MYAFKVTGGYSPDRINTGDDIMSRDKGNAQG